GHVVVLADAEVQEPALGVRRQRRTLGSLDLLELVDLRVLAIVGAANALGKQGLEPGVGCGCAHRDESGIKGGKGRRHSSPLAPVLGGEGRKSSRQDSKTVDDPPGAAPAEYLALLARTTGKSGKRGYRSLYRLGRITPIRSLQPTLTASR